MVNTSNSYCPYWHAKQLGIIIEYRHLPNARMVAAYSPDTDRVYIRPGLSPVVEKCALAHEIVHWEHGDSGTPKEEARANRIAAQRLIDPDTLKRAMADRHDIHTVAIELGVTLNTLKTYLQHVQPRIEVAA